MINQTTDEANLELADRSSIVAKYEALELLKDANTPAGKAFKTLILDGYMKDKAVEFTSLLAAPGMQGQRSIIFEALAGISHFENYLHMVENLGAPLDDEDELEE